MAKYDPVKDIPDLSGKVILVTGGTAGLGRETVLSLAAHSPALIYFTGRSTARAESLIAALKTAQPHTPVTFLEMDLASLASVQAGARSFLQSSPRLDILIANAGVMALPPALTRDGYEIQFGTNHLGHALLLKHLLPRLAETASASGPGADARIVFLSSLGFGGHPAGGIQFAGLKTPQDGFWVGGPWQRYGQSKLANILYAAELARRHPAITSVSIHPGVFKTGLVSELGWGNRALIWVTNLGHMADPSEGGAANTCWAATSPREGITNGGFYEPVGVKGRRFRENANEKLAAQLWDWTEKELESY